MGRRTWANVLTREELVLLRRDVLRGLKLEYAAAGEAALAGDLFRVRQALLTEIEDSLAYSGLELYPTFTTFRHATDASYTISHRGLTP